MPRLDHDLGYRSEGAEQRTGRAAPVAAHHIHEMTDDEYEMRLRILVRIVSVCTLGLISFAAGLLIGAFVLF
jgi:hypothetical protein